MRPVDGHVFISDRSYYDWWRAGAPAAGLPTATLMMIMLMVSMMMMMTTSLFYPTGNSALRTRLQSDPRSKRDQ